MLVLLLVLSAITGAAEPSELIGLWGNETLSGPRLSGGSPRGRATGALAGQRGRGDGDGPAGGRCGRFVMPGGEGQFRGRLADGSIEGVWIQPPGQTLGSAYATPLVLPRGDVKVSAAQLDPLQDRVTQYLRIEPTGDGALGAFLVNPEYNLGRGIRYDVHVDGNAIVLTDSKRVGWALSGCFDEETGQLRVDWQGIGVFPFTRRDRDDAVGYYATTPAASQDTYTLPVPAGHGWTTAWLGDVDMQVAPMLALQRQIASSDAPAPGDSPVHGLLVARRGKLVFESYLRGTSREQTHDTRSAGKSFASLLVGMAIYHGADFTAETPVLSLFPYDAHAALVDADSERSRSQT